MSDIVKPATPQYDKTVPLKVAQSDIPRSDVKRALHSLTQRLNDAGFKTFDNEGLWELSLCSLIMQMNNRMTVQNIIEALPQHGRYFDVVDFLNVMTNLGYYCRKNDTNIDNIDPRLLPALFISDNNTPYVIIGQNSQDKLIAYDPEAQKSIVLTKDKGTIWLFQIYDENRSKLSKFMRSDSGKSWFSMLIRRFRKTIKPIVLSSFFINILSLSSPLFIMLVYDRVIASQAHDILPVILVGAIIAILFEWWLRHIRSRGLMWLTGRLDNTVGKTIFSHLVDLPPNLIEKASIASQIARVKTFEAVRDFFSGPMMLALLDIPFILISILIIGYLGGGLVLVPLGMSCAYIGLFLIMRSKVNTAIKLAAKTSSIKQQFTIDTTQKLVAIQRFGLSQHWHNKFRHITGREFMTHFQLGWLGTVSETLAHALTVISALLILGFGVLGVWAGTLSPGALVACMILVWRVLTPFYSLCMMVPRLEQLTNSIYQVNKLMDIDTEDDTTQNFSRLPRLKGSVTFNHVHFSYNENRDAVLSGVSFHVKPGKICCITGQSGSGKATIMKLMQALYRPQSGSILIDGFDLRQLDIKDIRRRIAYVPKKPNLFNLSILDNIRLSNPLATMEDIKKALKLVDIYDELLKLKDGLNTHYAESHLALQPDPTLIAKIGIVRALIQPSQILLIDEIPPSVWEGQCGDNLKTYLARCRGEKTIFISSNEETLINTADLVIYLNNDAQAVAGTPSDITKNIMRKDKEARYA